MDALSAVIAAAAAWGGSILLWRRIRLARAGRRAPEAELLVPFDHAALASDLAVLTGGLEKATTVEIEAPEDPLLGRLPEKWAESIWADARPPAHAALRDALLEGDTAGVPIVPPPPSLYVFAFLHHFFADRLERAFDVLHASEKLLPEEQVLPLLRAMALAREAERLPAGEERESKCEAALASLDRSPALPTSFAFLAAHLEVLRLTPWNLEVVEWLVRRRLRRAEARDPDSPLGHRIRAALAATLGEGDLAADHLARALYHGRGSAYHAAPILSSAWLARARPALVARAASPRLTPPSASPYSPQPPTSVRRTGRK